MNMQQGATERANEENIHKQYREDASKHTWLLLLCLCLPESLQPRGKMKEVRSKKKKERRKKKERKRQS